MSMTYATIAGLVTRPGSDIGIRARIKAIPMTAGGVLTFPSEGRLTWGPEVATTGSDGSLSMDIPTGHGLTDLYWRIIAEPLDTSPGISTWTLGTYQITEDADLADLVDVDLVAVTPDLEERITALVADAEAAALLWQPSVAVTSGATRQAPDGSRIKSTASRTTRSSFDATEKTFWKSVLGTAGTMEADDLTASYAGRVTGPRGVQRVKQELRPLFGIEEQYPKPEAHLTHRIIWAGNTTWYAWGHDAMLRYSADQGRTWFRVFVGDATGQMGRDGLFLKPAGDNSVLLTTWHPYDGSTPSLIRSTNSGSNWTVVIGPSVSLMSDQAGKPITAGSKFLGPNSVVKSPATGNLFYGEYVTETPATRPTYKIWKSTDNGLNWTEWKSLSRAYDTDPEVGTMHCHSIQVDPFTDRLWACIGDAAKSAGLYRFTADESDWEAICTNRMSGAMPSSGAGNAAWCGAVSLMFFPDYIAWGVDQNFTANLLRLARTEFGDPAPTVEEMGALNSTAFYAARTSTAHTEYVLSASQEGGPTGGRMDGGVHLYRVADNAAELDEIGSFPVHDQGSSFGWAAPVGGTLGDLRDNLIWWTTVNVTDYPPLMDSYQFGSQFSGRIAWTNHNIVRPSQARLFGVVESCASELFAAVGAGGYRDFGYVQVPRRNSVLYIIDSSVKATSGAGAIPRLEIWRTIPFGVAKLDGGATDASLAGISRKYSLQAEGEPFIHKITGLAAGEEIQFRLTNGGVSNVLGATTAGDLRGRISFAWGYA
jgi:hypothetical protein